MGHTDANPCTVPADLGVLLQTLMPKPCWTSKARASPCQPWWSLSSAAPCCAPPCCPTGTARTKLPKDSFCGTQKTCEGLVKADEGGILCWGGVMLQIVLLILIA